MDIDNYSYEQVGGFKEQILDDDYVPKYEAVTKRYNKPKEIIFTNEM